MTRLQVSGCSVAIAAAVGLLAAPVPGRPQDAPPAVAMAGDVDAGAEAYGAECRTCHAGSIAPTLRGVIDRPVAGVQGFTGYSEGLKAKKALTWTEANLDAFLRAPTEFAPGTRMFKATPDARTRADIIAYLKSLPPPR